jgi:hypothetical protein
VEILPFQSLGLYSIVPRAPGMPFAPEDGSECSAETAFDNINTGMQTAIMMANIDCFKIIRLSPLPVATLSGFPAERSIQRSKPPLTRGDDAAFRAGGKPLFACNKSGLIVN